MLSYHCFAQFKFQIPYYSVLLHKKVSDKSEGNLKPGVLLCFNEVLALLYMLITSSSGNTRGGTVMDIVYVM